jgi:hypothetical protein
MPTLTGAIIRQQLQYDLIGKDSQRGITLSYGWLANQCGHAMLGFVPTHLVYYVLTHWFCVSNAAPKAAIGVALFWVAFETYNVIKPLQKQKGQTAAFPPDWKNIIYDTATDLGFFCAGAMAAGLLLGYRHWMLGVFVVVALLLRKPTHYWYQTKMYQQAAEYPIQFRLNQWDGPMDPEDEQAVRAFASITESGYHLLITGAYKSGKTSLGVALANEFSIRHQPCKYLTAVKLFGLFAEAETDTPKVPSRIWTWRKASFLVIDDINTGLPDDPDMITPAIFLRHMQHPELGELNKKALLEKNVIWVLGASTTEVLRVQNEWETLLIKMGVKPEKLVRVNLP